MLHPHDQKRLDDYVSQYITHGYTPEQVKAGLVGSGWPERESEAAIQSFLKNHVPHPSSPKHRVHAKHGLLERAGVLLTASAWVQALVLGVVSTLILKLFLPTESEQIIMQFVSSFSDSIFPPVLVPVLLITLAIAVALGVGVQYGFRQKNATESFVYTALLAVLLGVIIADSRTVGNTFLLWLTPLYVAAFFVFQKINIRKHMLRRLGLVIFILILLVFAMRTLNLG
ncbi:MAG: hypothetical protein WBP26_00510 [Candidatus Saccharimonadales bacterium]